MSWFDDIVDWGSSAWDWASGSSNSAALARAAGLAYLLNEVTSAQNPKNENTKDSPTTVKYSRETVDPDVDNSIPIVYGKAFIGGVVTDAVLSDDFQTMWYCITLCEKTGTLMSNGQDSVISFNKMYWNDNEIVFKSDGITAAKMIDADGNESTDIDGLIKVYVFNDGSATPTHFTGYSGNTAPAYTIFPDWTTLSTMDKLVFAIVKVTYDAEKSVTGLGTVKFQLSNTLKQPGDVLYDYMFNTRYGAGINSDEIYSV